MGFSMGVVSTGRRPDARAWIISRIYGEIIRNNVKNPPAEKLGGFINNYNFLSDEPSAVSKKACKAVAVPCLVRLDT